MSMFDNMVNAFGMLNADSFTGGAETPTNPMNEMEQAMTMNNLDQVPVDNMAGTMMGMPGKKVAVEVDEIEKKDPMAEFMKMYNAQGAGDGGYVGQTMSGQSMAGNMAKMFGGGF